MPSIDQPVNEFADRLRFALDRAGLTQKALAEQVGVSQAAIGFLLSGRNKSTSPKTLDGIASALDVSVDWLKGRSINIGGSKGDIETGSPDSVFFYDNCPEWIPKTSEYEFKRDSSRFIEFSKTLFAGKKSNIKASDCKIFTVMNDDMEPVLMRGDFVVVNCMDRDPLDSPYDQIYAVINNGVLGFCKISPLSGAVFLQLINYPKANKQYSLNDFAKDFTVVGKVIYRLGSSRL